MTDRARFTPENAALGLHLKRMQPLIDHGMRIVAAYTPASGKPLIFMGFEPGTKFYIGGNELDPDAEIQFAFQFTRKGAPAKGVYACLPHGTGAHNLYLDGMEYFRMEDEEPRLAKKVYPLHTLSAHQLASLQVVSPSGQQLQGVVEEGLAYGQIDQLGGRIVRDLDFGKHTNFGLMNTATNSFLPFRVNFKKEGEHLLVPHSWVI